jgi:hypothetical protein
MLVALRLLGGPTVLCVARANSSPEMCALDQALDCVLDVDMHVIAETSWGRAEFRPSETDDMYMGVYPCVSVHRYTHGKRLVLCCALGPIARHAAWNCLQLLHPKAWDDGNLGAIGIFGSPSVLKVSVAVEHVHCVWAAPGTE